MPKLPVAVFIGILCSVALSSALAQDSQPSLSDALAALEVPPAWFADISSDYGTDHPWKDARLKIRELLGQRGDKTQEAIKLTYLYARKDDIGDGHELPMYLFLGGEFAWAVQEYEKFLAPVTEGHTHAYLCLAACYRHFGEYEKAFAVLDKALTQLPKPPWRIANHANVEDYLGDLCADLGKVAEAKGHYRKAIALYPTSDQPYGRADLHRRAAKVQAKLDLLDLANLRLNRLRNGTYTGKSIAYAGQMTVSVTLRDGRITNIKLKHEEKIDQGATKIIPQRIIAKQSLKVDGITGATVTYQSILDGTLQALRTAGLQ